MSQTVLRKYLQLRGNTNLTSLNTLEKRKLVFDFGTRVVVFPQQRKTARPHPSQRCRVAFDVLSRTYNIDSTMVAVPSPPPQHIVWRP